MSIIGRKLGKFKKHNEQILEYNRFKPTINSYYAFWRFSNFLIIMLILCICFLGMHYAENIKNCIKMIIIRNKYELQKQLQYRIKYIHTYVHTCVSYNTGKSAFPDIYTQHPRVCSVWGWVRMCIYQAKHNTQVPVL